MKIRRRERGHGSPGLLAYLALALALFGPPVVGIAAGILGARKGDLGWWSIPAGIGVAMVLWMAAAVVSRALL